MTILAIYSNKGGVGKTTTAVNLSYLAAQSGMRTLVCDLDPQGSSTYYFRVKPKLKRKARGFSRWNRQIARSIKGTDYQGLDLLPADFTHRNLDITFHGKKRAKYRLARVLRPLRKDYDLVVVDCPTTINILAENILHVSDTVLVPVIPTTLSVRALLQLWYFLKDIKFRTGSVYSFFSLVDRSKLMHRRIMTDLRKNSRRLLKSDIPCLPIIEEMGIKRQPVPAFAPNSKATDAYKELWSDMGRKKIYRS